MVRDHIPRGPRRSTVVAAVRERGAHPIAIAALCWLVLGRALAGDVSDTGASTKAHPAEDPCAPSGSGESACLTVEVDFAAERGAFVNIATGFLGHIDTEPERPGRAHLEEALRPYMWRHDRFCSTDRCESSAVQDRAFQAVVNNGGIFQKVACKGYSRSFGKECRDLNVSTPWDPASEAGQAWFQACYDEASDALSHGRDPQWDVWNEPNDAKIFRDEQGLLRGLELAQTYQICYEALAAAYADHGVTDELRVGGPSMSSAPWDLLGFLFREGSPGQQLVAASDLPQRAAVEYGDFGFLEYLDQRPNVQLDFLSLHLFTNEFVVDWPGWIEIVRAAVRQEIIDGGLGRLRSRWGDDLSGLPIYVNEVLGNPTSPDYHLRPGHSVVAAAAMHQAGVAGAARACWPDPSDESSGCANKTLTGLLVPDGGNDPSERRAVWWAYNYYAELDDRESVVVSSYPRVAGLAAADVGEAKYRLLLGFTSATRQGDLALATDRFPRTDIVMRGLPGSCPGATVSRKLISSGGFLGAFRESDLAIDDSTSIEVVDGAASLVLNDFGAEDVFYVVVTCLAPPDPPTGLTVTD